MIHILLGLCLLCATAWGQNGYWQEWATFKSDPFAIDVPAVEEPIESHIAYDDSNGMAVVSCTHGGQPYYTGKNHLMPAGCRNGHYTTCSDKRRVLLTDEGGGKHCILFPQQEKP